MDCMWLSNDVNMNGFGIYLWTEMTFIAYIFNMQSCSAWVHTKNTKE